MLNNNNNYYCYNEYLLSFYMYSIVLSRFICIKLFNIRVWEGLMDVLFEEGITLVWYIYMFFYLLYLV